MTLLMLLHVASTLFMVGLIWFVQVVHYPLFAAVGEAGFKAYEEAHNRLTSWVVIPAMLIELITACILIPVHPAALGMPLIYLGLLLVIVAWASTFFLQVPQHTRLIEGFDPRAHARLVATNWIRTIAWSARGVLVLFMLQQMIPADGL